jgi:transmembrane sensor
VSNFSKEKKMISKKSIKSIIIAHLEGNLQGDELKRLYEWLSRSKDNQRYYARIKDIWESSASDAGRLAETEKEWGRFLSMITENYQYNIFRFKTNIHIFYRFAAILIVGMAIGAVILRYITPKESLFVSAMAPKGSVSQLVLADSTIVFLNAGSQILYTHKAGDKEREVFLEGEAWFDVAKNINKSFIVHTSTYDVKVTGTKFNVKSYAEDKEVITTLEEGHIRITSSEKIRLQRPITLKPGEQVALDKQSNKIAVMTVNPSIYTSWKDNKLIFLNMDLAELIILLERKYGVDIQVDDSGILKYHYTGTIKNETILEILDIIKHTLPIEYKIEDQTVHIQKEKLK